MFGDKRITTLAEDFKELGLIRGETVQEPKKTAMTESKNIDANRRQALIAKKKMIEQKRQSRLQKISEIKRARLQKRVQEQKLKTQATAKKESTGVAGSLQNLMAIEQRLKTSSSVSELLKAFENVSRVSSLAMYRFKKLAEAEALADKGQEVKPDMNDKTDKPQAGKDVPDSYLDVLGGEDIEGNVGHDKEDEQEGNVDKTKEVPTVTKKYAGKDATVTPAEVDIVEGEDVELGHEDGTEVGEEDDLDIVKNYQEGEEEEEPMATEDELAMPSETPTDEDAEMGDTAEGDDTDFTDDELDSLSDDELAELENELKATEGEELPATLPVAAEDDEIEPDPSDPHEDEEDEPSETDEEDDEPTPTPEPAPQFVKSVESKKAQVRKESRIAKKAYIAELADIKKEAVDIMQRIRKHAVTPQDAEAVLKDIVMRLGGAVGDLADMNKYAASGVEKKFTENKKIVSKKSK
jgi:hypothetical protein